jgi:phosphosulfolactate synthase
MDRRSSDPRALSVVRLPERPEKPRASGLTIAADRGLGSHAQEDLLETAAPYIDFAKLAMGLARLLPEALVRRKVALYSDAGIPVFLAGELSELAVVQGVAPAYYRAVAELGAWGVEISNAQVAMGIAAKARLIETARGAGLAVVAECGRKGGIDWTQSLRLVEAEIRACLDAGAERVLVQAEGLNEAVTSIDGRLIQDLVGTFGLERLVFQAKEDRAMTWFLSTFGAGVNLDVDHDQVLDLEARRLGIRKRGVFGLMAGA